MNFLTGGRSFLPRAVFAAPGDPPAGDPPAGDPPAGDPPSWTPPEGLPDEFKGADAAETLGKVLTGYTEANTRAEGLRTKLAGQPAPPKTADEYKFEPAEDVKPWFGDPDKNPILGVARASAHKLGLSNDQFGGFINDVYSEAAKGGFILPPLDPASEVKSYKDARGITSDEDVTAEFKANEDFAKGLIGQLKGLPEDQKIRDAMTGQLMQLTDTFEGNLALRAIAARLADSGLRVTGDPAQSDGEFFGKDELSKMAEDPRADPGNKDYDKDFRTKLDKSYAKHYPAQN